MAYKCLETYNFNPQLSQQIWNERNQPKREDQTVYYLLAIAVMLFAFLRRA